MILRLLRRTATVLIAVGAAIAVGIGSFNSQTTEELSTPQGLLSSVSSPLLVLALGVALRIAVGPMALLAAVDVVLSEGSHISLPQDPRSRLSQLLDRYHLANSHRSLRWSAAAHILARRRLGRAGTIMYWAESGLKTLSWVGFAVFLVLLVVSVG